MNGSSEDVSKKWHFSVVAFSMVWCGGVGCRMTEWINDKVKAERPVWVKWPRWSKFYSNKWRHKFCVHITLPPTPPPPQPVSIPSLMGDYASPMRPFIFPTCIRTQSLGKRERASVEWILGASHAMLHYPHPRNVRPFIHSSAHLNTIRERPSSYRSSSCYDSDNICIIGKLSILK